MKNDAGDDADDDELGDDGNYLERQERVAYWLLMFLGNRFMAQFVEASTGISMPITTTPYNPAQSMAMIRDANLSSTAVRKINSHHLANRGCRLTAKESNLNALGSKAVAPAVATKVIGGQKYTYWFKDLMQCVSASLSDKLTISNVMNLSTVDLIVSGDHGQGDFREVGRLVLRNNDGTVYDSDITFRIGEITCKKDTFALLKATLLPKLNDDLAQVITEDKKQGRLSIFKSAADDIYVVLAGQQPQNGGDTLIKEVVIRGFVTGDLAFYATILGKESGASNWCPFCKMGGAEFQKVPSERDEAAGELWTIQEIQTVTATVENGVPVTGVKEAPLLDSFSLEHFLIPVLHLLLGVGNRLFMWYKKFVLKLEDAPEDVTVASEKYLAAMVELEDINIEFDGFGQTDGQQLAHFLLERRLLNMWKKDTDTYSFLERKEMASAAKALSTDIKRLKKKAIEDKVSAQKMCVVNLKSERDTAIAAWRKSDPARGRLMWQHVTDTILLPNGVNIAAYHGGDLEGNACRTFMGEATIICERTTEFLVDQFATPGDTAKRTLIGESLRRVAEVLHLFDGYFSLLRTTPESYSAETPVQAKRFLDVAMDAWRKMGISVTPKAHICEDHSLSCLKKLKGLARYAENFMEQEHQFGMLHFYHTRGLRDMLRKAKSKSKWEAMSRNQAVVEAQAAKEKMRKRNTSQQLARERHDSSQLLKWQKRNGALNSYNATLLVLQSLEQFELVQTRMQLLAAITEKTGDTIHI